MANRWGNNGNGDRLLFSWAPKSLQMVDAAMKSKDACSLGKKAMTNLDNILKSRHYIPDKGQCSQIIIFPVAKYGCESWTVKKPEG